MGELGGVVLFCRIAVTLSVMLRRWVGPLLVGLGLAFVALGPVLGPGALLNFDLVAVEHWPFPRSMWGLGPELPRSVPAELALATVAALFSGSVAVKAWFVAVVVGSFLTMFRLLKGLDVQVLGQLAGAIAYALNPFVLTRLAVGHLTIAGVYALAPLVLPIVLRGSWRRPQVVFASAALAFMGFFGGAVWLIAAVFGLAARRVESARAAVQGPSGGAEGDGRASPRRTFLASALMHLPWLVPSIFLLSDGPDLIVDEAFRPSNQLATVASLPLGYGFWQPLLEVGTGVGWLSGVVGICLAALAVAGSRQLRDRFGNAAALMIGCGVFGVGVLNRSGPVVDWIFELPFASAAREPHRFLVLVLWWVIPAAVVGSQRVLAALAAWSESTISQLGLLIPAALMVVVSSPAMWGLHEFVTPVEVPTDWADARALVEKDPGTVLVLPWDRYLNVGFADDRRVLNPALRFFGPDIIHGGQLGITDAGQELADARLATLASVVGRVAGGGYRTEDTLANDLARHGVRWVIVLHEVDYRGFLSIAGANGIDHPLAGPNIDLFGVSASSDVSAQPLGGWFPGVATVGESGLLATPADGWWVGSQGWAQTTGSGIPTFPSGSRAIHLRSLGVLAGWIVSILVLAKIRLFRV